MKILMTGFTARGVGSTRLLYEFMSNTGVVKRTLELLGHTVDHRIVNVNEPNLTDKYDMALISIAVPQSLSSRYLFGAMWAAEQFGPKARFFVDDWLLHQMKSQLESGIRNPEKRFYSLDNRFDKDPARAHTDLWLKWFKHFSTGKYRLLLPAFPWAQTRKMLPLLDNVEGVIFDPTPMALENPEFTCGSKEPLNLHIEDPEDRERMWTLAAMRDVTKWFNTNRFQWPVDQYGNKRQGHPIVPERSLLHMYCKRWGIIGAPYEAVTDGGGWRVRYIHAALTHSVLFLDQVEGRVAGKPYVLWRSQVEEASTEELVSIAEAQREHLLKNTWSIEQLKTGIQEYLN